MQDLLNYACDQNRNLQLPILKPQLLSLPLVKLSSKPKNPPFTLDKSSQESSWTIGAGLDATAWFWAIGAISKMLRLILKQAMREWGFTVANLYKFKAERLRTDPPNAVWTGPVSALRWVPLSA
jgi:hypothetical protein